MSKRLLTLIYKRLYEFYGPQGWWPGRTRFEIICGAILTQNTAWTNVVKAIRNLRKARILSPAAMKDVGKKRLAELIRPAGYYNIKTKRLKFFLEFLYARYGGDLSKMRLETTACLRAELLGVNGIGPETCDSILLYAFGRPVFVVDAYTKRILSRHSILGQDPGYDEIQKYFMSRLPADSRLYNEFHALIVRVGKDCCRKAPRCGACPLHKITCKPTKRIL